MEHIDIEKALSHVSLGADLTRSCALSLLALLMLWVVDLHIFFVEDILSLLVFGVVSELHLDGLLDPLLIMC